VGAGHVGVVTDVSAEAAILVLAALEPSYYLLCLLFADWLLECGQTRERPVPASHFQVFSEVLADGIEVFAVVESEQVLRVFLPIKFDILVVHLYILNIIHTISKG
jgi:hypothetical protein